MRNKLKNKPKKEIEILKMFWDWPRVKDYDPLKAIEQNCHQWEDLKKDCRFYHISSDLSIGFRMFVKGKISHFIVSEKSKENGLIDYTDIRKWKNYRFSQLVKGNTPWTVEELNKALEFCELLKTHANELKKQLLCIKAINENSGTRRDIFQIYTTQKRIRNRIQ